VLYSSYIKEKGILIRKYAWIFSLNIEGYYNTSMRKKNITKGYCIFFETCDNFRPDSYTCQHGGGNYCGIYNSRTLRLRELYDIETHH